MTSSAVRDTRKPADELAAALAEMSARDLAGDQSALRNPEKPWNLGSTTRATMLFRDHVELLLLRFSLGEKVTVLAPLFPELLTVWELKVAVDRGGLSETDFAREHNFAMKRDMYQWASWMVCLGILLDASDEEFARVVTSVSGVGDRVLDRLIATRVPGHPLSDEVLWPKPFALLEAALDAPEEQRPGLMLKFVKAWFTQSRKNYWWGIHELSPRVRTKYFGYWNVEAAAAVAAFGIDDSALVGNEYYPADLVPARWRA
jgi:hypothetical protein